MVNKIPVYAISTGGKIAVVSARCHPATSQIMSVTCRETLESCGVDTDDIYLIDCPQNVLLPGMCREIAKSGSFAAVVGLAVLAEDNAEASAVRMGMTVSDYAVPVVPALVLGSAGGADWAGAAERAARSAIELINFSSMLSELASMGDLAELAGEGDGLLEEIVETPKPTKARAARRTTTRTTSNGRKRRR